MKKVSKKQFKFIAKSILCCLSQCPNNDERVCLYYRIIAVDFATNFKYADYNSYNRYYRDVKDLMLLFAVK